MVTSGALWTDVGLMLSLVMVFRIGSYSGWSILKILEVSLLSYFTIVHILFGCRTYYPICSLGAPCIVLNIFPSIHLFFGWLSRICPEKISKHICMCNATAKCHYDMFFKCPYFLEHTSFVGS